jgi:hypothetical protein
MRQGIRADIYLLDTATGRVWREYEDKRVGMFWKESPRESLPNPPAGYVLDKASPKDGWVDIDKPTEETTTSATSKQP